MTSGRPRSNGIHPSLAGHRHQASACHHWEVMAHSDGQSMPMPRCRPLLSLSLSPARTSMAECFPSPLINLKAGGTNAHALRLPAHNWRSRL